MVPCEKSKMVSFTSSRMKIIRFDIPSDLDF